MTFLLHALKSSPDTCPRGHFAGASVLFVLMERVEWACRGWQWAELSPALHLGYSCRDLGCPEEVFCAATGEKLLEGMLWGLPGFEL